MTPPRTAPGASRRRVFAGASALAGAAAMGIDAHAHGFGQRYDLPVPLSLYLTGAAAVVAVSFLIIAIFFRRVHAVADYPRIDLLRSPVGRMLAHPVIRAALRAAAVFLLILVVVAGFFGNPAPVKNIAPIMVWAIWWVGMAYVCALLGNLWALVNPLDTIFAWVERIYARLHHGAALTRGLRYPQALGAWPAVALFFGFAWAELIWDQSDRPAYVAAATLAYCAITWTGMLLYGRRAWLAHGEVYALIFALLGRFAPLETRTAAGHAELNVRPYAVGLLIDEPVHSSLMVLVVMMLATVTFDGFMETPLWVEIADQMSVWLATPGAADGPHAIVATLGLAGMMLAFLAIYLTGAHLVARFAAADAPPRTTMAIARLFVFTLVPIAIGYHLAHYLSFVVSAFQYLIPLISDPLGLGWDLFGTALHIVRIGIVDARAIWYASVIAIVLGHVAAVYLAHVMAVRVFGDRRAALRSQYPMLALMLGYTMMSLWIIAQPIVSSRFG